MITHTIADILRFRLLMIAAGYEDGNDASSLRGDPVFKMALDVAPSDRELASQSTISRFENLPDARALLRMGRVLVDLYCASFQSVPKRIVLDIDDTFDAVHGGQQLRLFNAHHDEYGFQPIVVFDGSGRFVSALLRPAKRPSGKEAERFLRRLLRYIRANWPKTPVIAGTGMADAAWHVLAEFGRCDVAYSPGCTSSGERVLRGAVMRQSEALLTAIFWPDTNNSAGVELGLQRQACNRRVTVRLRSRFDRNAERLRLRLAVARRFTLVRVCLSEIVGENGTATPARTGDPQIHNLVLMAFRQN